MKTLEDLEKLPDDELRVMLAELQGWLRVNDSTVPDRRWPCKGYITGKDGKAMFPPHGYVMGNGSISSGKMALQPPNYPGDLNACHEVELNLNNEQWPDYVGHLEKHGCARTWIKNMHFVHVTPRKRTIALILTLQKP